MLTWLTSKKEELLTKKLFLTGSRTCGRPGLVCLWRHQQQPWHLTCCRIWASWLDLNQDLFEYLKECLQSSAASPILLKFLFLVDPLRAYLHSACHQGLLKLDYFRDLCYHQQAFLDPQVGRVLLHLPESFYPDSGYPISLHQASHLLVLIFPNLHQDWDPLSAILLQLSSVRQAPMIWTSIKMWLRHIHRSSRKIETADRIATVVTEIESLGGIEMKSLRTVETMNP